MTVPGYYRLDARIGWRKRRRTRRIFSRGTKFAFLPVTLRRAPNRIGFRPLQFAEVTTGKVMWRFPGISEKMNSDSPRNKYGAARRDDVRRRARVYEHMLRGGVRRFRICRLAAVSLITFTSTDYRGVRFQFRKIHGVAAAGVRRFRDPAECLPSLGGDDVRVAFQGISSGKTVNARPVLVRDIKSAGEVS